MHDPALLDRIEINPKVLVGKPVIRGTRISVELILELLAGGWSFDDIQRNYPRITPDDIRACIAYARDVLEDIKVYSARG
jgi:uncharacterized protein (DUF433 family)